MTDLRARLIVLKLSRTADLVRRSKYKMPDDVWQLTAGGQTIARLTITGSDFPWLHARVQPCDGFDDLRPLFDQELRLLEILHDDTIPAWEDACQRIRQSVSLIKPDGQPVPEFLLHMEDLHAWWRWSDIPFAQPSKDQTHYTQSRET